MYSVEEVADHLGLHVRTVRGYIRSGRLKAVRIGKQYRIAPADLWTLTGRPAPSTRATPLEVSSIVQIEDIDQAAADRLSTLVQAGTNSGTPHGLRVQTVHDRERNRMKIIILGGAAATADALHLLEAVLENNSGLLSTDEANHG